MLDFAFVVQRPMESVTVIAKSQSSAVIPCAPSNIQKSCQRIRKLKWQKETVLQFVRLQATVV